MNHQSLVYFKTVAELQHYTKAAEALYISQPALSKAIHNLEVELGTPLFQKDGRNVALTRTGALFLEYVSRSIDEINRGVEAVRREVEIERNTIFMSALFSLYAVYLPDKILFFRRQYPSCRFSMEYKYTSAVLKDVMQGRCELGMCSNFTTEGEFSCLKKQTLFREPVELVVGKGHRLAGRTGVSVPELKDERFIVWVRSNLGTNKLLADLCRRYGFEPNITAEAYNDYGVLSMVAMGEGLAIIPTSSGMDTSNVVPVHLDVDVPLVRDISLVWRAKGPLSPMAVKFRDMLADGREADTPSPQTRRIDAD